MHLILDLDNTLLYGEIRHNKLFKLLFRPYLAKFLDYCFHNFETVNIWTAGTRYYFEAIYPELMKYVPEGKSFNLIYTSEKCTYKIKEYMGICTHRYVIKKIRKMVKKIPGATINNTLIVDDNYITAIQNYGNFVGISPFHGNDTDTELLNLIYKLKVIITHYKKHMTVRNMEKRSISLV